MRISIVIKQGALPIPDIILAAKTVKAGAGRNPYVILQGFCFKLTTSLPSHQNLIQQWQRAVGPGKQISGQFNSVNPRNSNHPSSSGRMGLDILTWLNELLSSSILACVLSQLPVCRFRFHSLQNYAQRTGYSKLQGPRFADCSTLHTFRFRWSFQLFLGNL